VEEVQGRKRKDKEKEGNKKEESDE